jgi:hypothetical protein
MFVTWNMRVKNLTLCEQTAMSSVVVKTMIQMIVMAAWDWATVAFIDKTSEQRV